MLLITGPFDDLSSDAEAGIFMLSVALGWVLIPIVSSICTSERHLWALFPAAIMALIGAGLIFGGILFSALELLGTVWPLFLIGSGFRLLLRQFADRKQAHK